MTEYEAASLATNQESVWLLFAGRLGMLRRNEAALANRPGATHFCFYEFCKYAVNQGFYDRALLNQHYTDKELKQVSSWLNHSRDLEYDYAGYTLLNKRYLHPQERLQEAYAAMALWLAVPEPRVNRLKVAHIFYEALSKRWVSLATPLLMNLRRPNAQLSSCFILSVGDSLESITQGWADSAAISKKAGGVGLNFSEVRAVKSWVGGEPDASGGVVPWVRIFNDISVAVNQQGKRKGAFTVALDVWHLDILEFIELRSEAGDPRRRAQDVFPQVVVSDLFMQRVKSNLNWTLVDPYEVEKKLGFTLHDTWGEKFEQLYLQAEQADLKLKKVMPARDILKLIMRTQIETGLPYIFFKDTANQANPNINGYIPSGNLCMESYSVVKADEYSHCCNLASLNLSVLSDQKDAEWAASIATRLLDNAIDLTLPPTKLAREHNKRFRTVGVGAMGLADWLAVRELKYGSPEAIKAVNTLFEGLSLACYHESIQLASERGSFSTFGESSYNLQEPLIMGRPKAWYLENACRTQEWQAIFDGIKTHGLRNSQLMAVAPNTSTSLVHRCVRSILPVYKRFYVDQASNSSTVAPPFLHEKYWFYAEYTHVPFKSVIDTVAAMQTWVDTGISFEWLFDLNQGVTAKDIYEFILYAWEKGIKGIYYVRSIEKRNEVACESCSN